MSTGAVLIRMIVYGLLLSAIDAVSGRALRASPDPSVLLSLGATAWAAYRLAEGGQRSAIPASLLLWIAFTAGFILWARLLVGWNGSVPWYPPTTRWIVGFALWAIVVAVAASVAGSRSATRTAQPSTTDFGR